MAQLPHTPGHRNCPACDAVRAEKMEPKKFGLLYFKHASALWLREHSPNIKPKTIRDYNYLLVPLTAFFGELPLEEIHIGHLQSYVDMRLQTPRRTSASAQRELAGIIPVDLVGPTAVRHEVTVLRLIMQRAGLWEPIGRDYKPPKLPKQKPDKVPEDEALTRLFMVACSNARWKVAYWGSMLQISSTCAHGEIRHLHLNDVDLAKRTMKIRDGLKNEHRDRMIELNENAFWAIGQILKRYHRTCRKLRIQPHGEHYILPGRTPGSGQPYDLAKPMGSWRSAWEKLREKAGLPGIQMRHMRHIAVTRLLENPEISERSIIETAGWIGKEMLKHYSSIRRKPKQEAMRTLEFPRPQPPPPVQAVESEDIYLDSAVNLVETNERKKE
jgi:integrase